MFAAKDTLLTRPSGGYQISRSVRLRSSATAYFNRTPSVAGNRQIWTWNAWVKRGGIGVTDYTLFSAGTSATDTTDINFSGNSGGDVFLIRNRVASTNLFILQTTPVYRDPAAWYMITAVFDTTQATAANRFKLYVNGVQVTVFSTATYGAQNSNTYANATNAHRIGASAATAAFFDGYLTEINFIDGQALTPSSFGETNAVTGVWQPKKYGGTYGTNGFYLNFSDNSAATAATIGKDYSGNGNNWTPNNISVTAGVTYDSMLDSPTPYADGGNGRGNYCTVNPLSMDTTTYTLSNANLNFAGAKTATGTYYARSTLGVSSGKWYWEITPTDVGGGPNIIVGIQDASTSAVSGGASVLVNGYGYNSDGTKQNNTTQVAYAATWTNGDVIGVALDLDAGTIVFYKNNTSQGTAFTGITSATYCPVISMGTGGTARTIAGSINFGQRPFTYTPPTGFKALNTQNLPAPTISNGASYMAASLYSGTGATQAITNTVNGISFQPDFVWIKSRSNALSHKLTNSVVGIQLALSSDSTAAESSDTGGVTAFNSNGFTIGTTLAYNTNAATFVGWQWNAGGSTVTNTSGTISAQVRANPTAGFSVVTYTGNGITAATVGHGLGVTPSMIIVKARSGGSDWETFHTSLGASFGIRLNTTAAKFAASSTAGGIISTSPTSTTFGFTAGTSNVNNANQNGLTFVAYCFSAVAGYSAFGSYTGNGSTDGTFIYTGFRPRFIIMKRTDAVADWVVLDTSRDTYNAAGLDLYPNTSGAEVDNRPRLDILSNGFKQRANANVSNLSGGTYIYMAFAENPFKNSLAR